jgi:uncharacterized protein (TIGR03086 family)
MDAVEYFGRTLDFHSGIIKLIGDSWSNPTPDDEWDVRALVNHVVGELVWMPPLLDGKTIADVGDRFDGDVLGDAPIEAWDAAAAGATAAIGASGASTRIVHLSFGDFPGAGYMDQVGSDLLIHAWDLARGIGADETMPSDLVAYCATWFADWQEGYRGAGVIADPPPVPDDADDQTRLLAAFGRKA